MFIWYIVRENISFKVLFGAHLGELFMEMFSEYDLIRAMSGADKYGEGKCMVAVKHQRCEANGNCVDVDDEFVTEKPIVNVFRQPGGFVLVDLYFRSVEDKDLKIVYSYLDRFLRAENSSSDDGLDFPLLSFAFLPKEFEGKYWALGVNPILAH